MLSAEGRNEEAVRLAIEIRAIERVIAEPATIINVNQPIFDKFDMSRCKTCGGIIKKLKSLITGKVS